MASPRDSGGGCGEGEPAECCGQLNGCSHDFGPAVCTSNAYTCPSGGSTDVACDSLCVGIRDGGLDAAGGKDAATHQDSAAHDAPAPIFACGNTTCNSATQYCQITEGGVPLPDGGSNMSSGCVSIPSACAATVTCACIQGAAGPQCKDVDGAVTVTIEDA